MQPIINPQELLSLPKQNLIIIDAGSGVTACHTILAMDYAGLPMPKLYVGSYSEWCRNKEVAP